MGQRRGYGKRKRSPSAEKTAREANQSVDLAKPKRNKKQISEEDLQPLESYAHPSLNVDVENDTDTVEEAKASFMREKLDRRAKSNAKPILDRGSSDLTEEDENGKLLIDASAMAHVVLGETGEFPSCECAATLHPRGNICMTHFDAMADI